MVKISGLNNKGQGLSKDEELNKTLKLWNSLPGEEIEYRITKKRKGTIEGYATEIINNVSDKRVEPKEPDHFISCSPWQIFDFDYENELKLNDILSKFKEAEIELPNKNPLIEADINNIYGYRNKMEFSFFGDDDENISIAFHRRSTKFGKIPIQECLLAEDIINKTAKEVVAWVNTLEIQARDLKTLILRSNGRGECIAAIFARISKDDLLGRLKTNPPPIVGGVRGGMAEIKGFHIYYSNPLSPASVPTELIYSEGDDYLETKIIDTKLKFGLNSFFQINIPIFEKALEDIAKFIPEDSEVIDYFSGVGSISLPLHVKFKSCKLVEINEEAVKYANENIKNNKIKNCEAILSPSEDMNDLIEENKVIILDPPREGVHNKLIEKLLEVKPKRIIYLSCNPDTQVRDIGLLQEEYKVTFMKLYNFFPRTPHVESLCVLEKRWQ